MLPTEDSWMSEPSLLYITFHNGQRETMMTQVIVA